jgi:hypothetical protein
MHSGIFSPALNGTCDSISIDGELRKRLVHVFDPLFSPNAGTRIEARSFEMPTTQDRRIVINLSACDSNREFTSGVSMIMTFSSQSLLLLKVARAAAFESPSTDRDYHMDSYCYGFFTRRTSCETIWQRRE